MNQGNQTTSNQEEKPGFFSFSNLKSLAILITVIFAIRWSIASPYHVPTASMEPTIKVGDRLMAFKLAYNLKLPFTDIVLLEWSKPSRGDIIVFRFPENPSLDYVKRVIGVPGDRIQLIDDELYVNGERQPRTSHDHDRAILEDIHDPKATKKLFIEHLNDRPHWVMQDIPSIFRRMAGRNWPPSGDAHVVPEASYFVMGDNRDNSSDSRVWKHVPESFIRGKALFVLISLQPIENSWIPAIRFARFGHWLDGELADAQGN
jgi:signal peptidase I